MNWAILASDCPDFVVWLLVVWSAISDHCLGEPVGEWAFAMKKLLILVNCTGWDRTFWSRFYRWVLFCWCCVVILEAVSHYSEQILALILNLVLKICLSLADILLNSWLFHLSFRVDHSAVPIIHILCHWSVGSALPFEEAMLDFLDLEWVGLEVVVDLLLAHFYGYDSLLLFLVLVFIRLWPVSIKCHIWAIWGARLLIWKGSRSVLIDDDDIALIGVRMIVYLASMWVWQSWRRVVRLRCLDIDAILRGGCIILVRIARSIFAVLRRCLASMDHNVLPIARTDRGVGSRCHVYALRRLLVSATTGAILTVPQRQYIPIPTRMLPRRSCLLVLQGNTVLISKNDLYVDNILLRMRHGAALALLAVGNDRAQFLTAKKRWGITAVLVLRKATLVLTLVLPIVIVDGFEARSQRIVQA